MFYFIFFFFGLFVCFLLLLNFFSNKYTYTQKPHDNIIHYSMVYYHRVLLLQKRSFFSTKIF